MSAASEMSEDIDMIRKSAEGLANRRDLTRIRRLRYSARGFDPVIWRSMCDLGWTAIRLGEERGGVGLSMAAYCALAEELGAALVPEPIISAVLTAGLLDDMSLSDHIEGETLVLPAWQDTRDAAGPSEGLRLEGDRLYGRKCYVQMAAGADSFLAIDFDQCWLVSASDSYLGVDLLETQDGGHLATITFAGSTGRRIEVNPRPVLAEACLATSAYLMGITEAAFDRSLEYLKMRVQFGKSLSSFQALQHRSVDLKLQVELTRASVEEAAMRWDRGPGAAESYAAISRAKVRATNTSMLVTRQAIQLHGGIGFTDEHDIGLYLRKAMVVAPQFGSAALHRARYAELSPAVRERS